MLKTNKRLRNNLVPREREIAPWKKLPPKGKVDTSLLDYGVVIRKREEIKPHKDLALRKGFTRCEWCGMEIDIKIHKQDPHHIIPGSVGGPDHAYNLMMLCGPKAAWGCHKDAQEGRLTREELAKRHSELFPEIRDGVHLLEEIEKMRTHVNRG